MRLSIVALLTLLLSACAGHTPHSSGVSHVVLVWFKDTVSTTDIADIHARSLELHSIPGLTSIQAGAAVPSERPIVDDSFDLGLVMRFKTVEAMQAYLTHPQHKALVRQHIRGKVKRLQVYDILDRMH